MKFKTITMLMLAGLLVACDNDEPTPSGGSAIQVKLEADRTILIGAADGKIYNMEDGSVYATLPGCAQITDMAMHGEDYYVAGYAQDNGNTYWVNGEALHINSLYDNSLAVARSFDHVYVLTLGQKCCLYRDNTKYAETQDASDVVALAAYGDKFYVAGNKSAHSPALWTNSGVMELDNGGRTAHATGIDLITSNQGVTHLISGYQATIVDGSEVYEACMWRNGALSTLPLNVTDSEKNNHTYKSSKAFDVAHYGSKVYVTGYRSDARDRHATVWVASAYDEDEVKTYWQADGNVDAQAQRVLVYGSDVYVKPLSANA